MYSKNKKNKPKTESKILYNSKVIAARNDCHPLRCEFKKNIDFSILNKVQ